MNALTHPAVQPSVGGGTERPVVVLIPAYEPGDRLVQLVADLRAADPSVGVLVVDDGSGPAYAPLFRGARDAGATVVSTARPNRGKGFTLREGVAAAVEIGGPEAVIVTADCDGQHAVPDILRVASEAAARPGTYVLGGRRFAGEVPLRSRFGNSATRVLFRAVTGAAVGDTQTGLRGFTADLAPWLDAVPGDRFEYEFNALLAATRAAVPLHEIEIATIYLDENESSHFRPVRDSIRIYAPLLKFAGSSFMGFTIDTAALLAFTAFAWPLWAGVVGARVMSSAANFAVNRRAVFRDTSVPWWHSAARYYALAVVLLAANFVVLWTLTAVIGMGVLLAKILTEILVWVGSYVVQHRWVFARRGGEHTAELVGADPARRAA